MDQPVIPGNRKNRMLAQYRALNRSSYRSGHDDPCEHCLVQIADDFFNRNVTAAMGALNAAAIPAAAPTGKSRLRLSRESAAACPRLLAMPAQICTVGPSRPSDDPEPICNTPTRNLPTDSFKGTRPPLTA